MEAFVLSGKSSSESVGRRDDRCWLSSQGLSLTITTSKIASSDNKVSLKKSWDGEEGMSAHLGREYWSSSFLCEKQTLDSVSHCISKYDNLADDNDIVSPWYSTYDGFRITQGSPKWVPTEEILLIGAIMVLGIARGNTPIIQGSLNKPALTSSWTW